MVNKIVFIFVLFLTVSGASEIKKYNRDFSQTKDLKANILTNEGLVVIELDYTEAPMTVANFEYLAKSGFYQGSIFHRIIQGFMTQGGDSSGTGMGDPGFRILDEKNQLKHETGVISMANTGQENSGGSQFFITHLPQHHLDGKHTVFGKVISGMDVVLLLEKGDPILNIEIMETKVETE